MAPKSLCKFWSRAASVHRVLFYEWFEIPDQVEMIYLGLLSVHLQCWEVLPFLPFSASGVQRSYALRTLNFDALLALNGKKGTPPSTGGV